MLCILSSVTHYFMVIQFYIRPIKFTINWPFCPSNYLFLLYIELLVIASRWNTNTHTFIHRHAHFVHSHTHTYTNTNTHKVTQRQSNFKKSGACLVKNVTASIIFTNNVYKGCSSGYRLISTLYMFAADHI